MLYVLKLGGSILGGEVPKSFLEELREVNNQGHNTVLVHGGGKTVSEISKKMGKEPRFIVSPKGFRSRYTDRETAEIFAMVMSGKINKSIVSAIQRIDLQAIGISGIDGGMVKAKRKKELLIVDERGRRRIIGGDYSGKIVSVDSGILKLLLEAKYIPVISPIAIGEDYEMLNVDGDRLAAHIAGSLKADSLMLFTNVDGILLGDEVLGAISYSEAKELLPKIGHGMITKLYAALEALDMGVKEVRVTSGLNDKPITEALENRKGTLITNDRVM